MRKKIVVISLIFIIMLSALNSVFATNSLTESFTGKIEGSAADGATKIREIISIALRIVRVAGTGIAIVILMVIGCKYMISSPGERAEIKKHATIYVLGAIVMIAASGIIGIIQTFVAENIK